MKIWRWTVTGPSLDRHSDRHFGFRPSPHPFPAPAPNSHRKTLKKQLSCRVLCPHNKKQPEIYFPHKNAGNVAKTPMSHRPYRFYRKFNISHT